MNGSFWGERSSSDGVAFSLGPNVTIKVDMEHNLITAENEQGNSLSITFSLNEFDRELVMARGWLAYADQKS